MVSGEANLDEMIVLKHELTRDIEDVVDQAIRSERSQGRMSQSDGAEHAQEVMSQVVQEDQDLLGMPEPLATMGEQETLFVIADLDLSRSSQVIDVTDLLRRRVQVGDHKQSVFVFGLAVVQPAKSQSPSRHTELELVGREGDPTMPRIHFKPLLYLGSPGSCPATGVVLGTQLVTLL
jgi:hypothetical protein